MGKDIKTKEDLELLINTFYDRVRKNSVIGPIFTEIVAVDWEAHLPTMYAFWDSLLLGGFGYAGNPMQQHIALSKRAVMGETEFAEWLRLFTATIDDLYKGEKAEEAKLKAKNLAHLMLHKIQAANE